MMDCTQTFPLLLLGNCHRLGIRLFRAKIVADLIDDVLRSGLIQGNFALELAFRVDQLLGNLQPGLEVLTSSLARPSWLSSNW